LIPLPLLDKQQRREHRKFAMARDASKLDLDLLLAFRALLTELSVTRAASALEISQPALSARLARLRTVFADPLFVASPANRGVEPTPRALALRPDLLQAIALFERMTAPAAAFQPEIAERTFVVALRDNPAAMLGPEFAAAVAREAPRARLALVLPDPRRIADDLETGAVDLFIGGRDEGRDGWMGSALLSEDFLTAQRKRHPRGDGPLDLDTLCTLDHLLISADGGGFSGMLDEALAKLGRVRRVSVSVQSYALAPMVLAATDCLCTLPRRLLQRFGGELDAFPPPLPLEPFPLSAFWRPRSQHDPAHVWLRSVVAAVAAPLRGAT